MAEQQHTPTTALTAREQALELEVARLTAELETLRGEDPTAATSRFLSMAAATVDQAVADARREADELAVEISAAAEARRDEATRLAAEAEANAERLKDEASRAQEILDDANEEAESIRATAVSEAAEVAAKERERVAAEIESLTEVRTSLEDERAALENYHEELSRRVQDMAEAMVAFMTTEPPILGGTAIPAPTTPELGTEAVWPRPAGGTDTDADVDADADAEVDAELDHTDADDAEVGAIDADLDSETDAEDGAVDADLDAEDGAVDADLDVDAELETHVDDAWLEMGREANPWTATADGPREEDDVPDLHTEADIPEDDAFNAALATAIGADPDELADAVEGQRDDFAGVPVLDDDAGAGLFDPATDEEVAPRRRKGSLFSAHGSRWVEQTPPDDLAEALDDDSTAADEAFEEFLSGDGEPDPSRDWLLRPDQS